VTGTKIYSYLSGPPGIPRHTFTSSLTRSGVDLVTVKDVLGHATSDTTVRYAHSDYDTEARAVAKLPTSEQNSVVTVFVRRWNQVG
jgi:integrase